MDKEVEQILLDLKNKDSKDRLQFFQKLAEEFCFLCGGFVSMASFSTLVCRNPKCPANPINKARANG